MIINDTGSLIHCWRNHRQIVTVVVIFSVEVMHSLQMKRIELFVEDSPYCRMRNSQRSGKFDGSRCWFRIFSAMQFSTFFATSVVHMLLYRFASMENNLLIDTHDRFTSSIYWYRVAFFSGIGTKFESL